MQRVGLGPPIPAILWESLQHSMTISVRRLVKDIGSSLGLPEKELLNGLLKSGDAMVRPYLFEEASPHELECRCDYIMQYPSSPTILQVCGQPILWTKDLTAKRCPAHFGASPPSIPNSLPILTRVEAEAEDQGPLFVDSEGVVYDAAYSPKGRYKKDSKTLFLFHVE